MEKQLMANFTDGKVTYWDSSASPRVDTLVNPSSDLLITLVSAACLLLILILLLFICLNWDRFTILMLLKKRRIRPQEKQSIDFVVPDIRVTQMFITTPLGGNNLKYSALSKEPDYLSRCSSTSVSSHSIDGYLSDYGVTPTSEDERHDVMSSPLNNAQYSRSHDDLLTLPVPCSPDTSNGSYRRYTMERFDIQPNELRKEQYLQSEEALNSNRQYSSCELGKICFSLSYNFNTEVLTVVVRKAVNLCTRPNRVLADPYVQLTLLPDKNLKYVTNIHQRTLNPVFCQTFLFPVKFEEFQSKTLKFTVFDHMRIFRRNKMGRTLFPLRELGAVPPNMEYREIWRPLLHELPIRGSSPQQGELLVAISMDHNKQSFTLSAFQVKNLHLSEEEKSNSYILLKTTVMVGQQIIASKRTKSKKYKETLAFNREFRVRVPRDCINQLNVSIAVFIKHSISSARLIGRSLIGPYSYASGTGLKHWINMLANPIEPSIMWHKLL